MEQSASNTPIDSSNNEQGQTPTQTEVFENDVLVSESNSNQVPSEASPGISLNEIFLYGLRKALAERKLRRLEEKGQRLTKSREVHLAIGQYALGSSFMALKDKAKTPGALLSSSHMPQTIGERRHAYKASRRADDNLRSGVAMHLLAQSFDHERSKLGTNDFKDDIRRSRLSGKVKRASKRGSRAYIRSSKKLNTQRENFINEALGKDAFVKSIDDRLEAIERKKSVIRDRFRIPN